MLYGYMDKNKYKTQYLIYYLKTLLPPLKFQMNFCRF